MLRDLEIDFQDLHILTLSSYVSSHILLLCVADAVRHMRNAHDQIFITRILIFVQRVIHLLCFLSDHL